MAEWGADDGGWDIVSSVGATALGAATMRAVEARKPDPLVRDDYAQYFVAATAAQAPAFSEALDNPEVAGQSDIALFSSYLGARTKYFDDFYLDATAAGVRQVVILASGLDVRGYRLPWAPGTTVYELDVPNVLDFKHQVLVRHGVEATATVRALPVDLRNDWPATLTAAGFDQTRPTAWLAEGLLPFLPGVAQDLLFERIAVLSAPNSRLAIEDFEASGNEASDLSVAVSEGSALRRMLNTTVDDAAKPPAASAREDRADPVAWWSARRWSVDTTTARELLVAADRAPLAGTDALTDLMGNARYVTATLTSSSQAPRVASGASGRSRR
jgi:methyltransferase (TIGR00027 family)